MKKIIYNENQNVMIIKNAYKIKNIFQRMKKLINLINKCPNKNNLIK